MRWGATWLTKLRVRPYADRDDSLDAARQDLASDLGCEAWELTVEWDDPTERGSIIVRATARRAATCLEPPDWLA